jgi:hypothetical protein
MRNPPPEIDSFALKFIYPVSLRFMEGIVINSRPILRAIDFSIYLFVCQVNTGIILIALSLLIHWQKRFITNFIIFVSRFTHLLIDNLHRLLSIWLYLNGLLLNLININWLRSLLGVLGSIHRRLYCPLALWFFNFFCYLYLCSLVIRTGYSSL